MNIDELPTPAVVIDLDAVERNIRKMQDFVNSRGCGVRPHAKSHKSPFIAKKQMDAGAVGQCCQTLIEAEALMLNGIDHVLLTTNLASRARSRGSSIWAGTETSRSSSMAGRTPRC